MTRSNDKNIKLCRVGIHFCYLFHMEHLHIFLIINILVFLYSP
jgi:hypothetical protein